MQAVLYNQSFLAELVHTLGSRKSADLLQTKLTGLKDKALKTGQHLATPLTVYLHYFGVVVVEINEKRNETVAEGLLQRLFGLRIGKASQKSERGNC